MNDNNNVAGTPDTAPATATETAARKVMVLAIHRDNAGQIAITPINIEHEDHNPSSLNKGQEMMRGALGIIFMANRIAMKTALDSVFQMYEQQLYRGRSRTFADFCAVIFGTNPIDDTIAAKAKAQVAKLKLESKEGQI